MESRRYTLTVRTSRRSATAFPIRATCDEEAVGRALGMVETFGRSFGRPPFEIVRADGTIVRTPDPSAAR
jgi:hypothetical protein